MQRCLDGDDGELMGGRMDEMDLMDGMDIGAVGIIRGGRVAVVAARSNIRRGPRE